MDILCARCAGILGIDQPRHIFCPGSQQVADQLSCTGGAVTLHRSALHPATNLLSDSLGN